MEVLFLPNFQRHLFDDYSVLYSFISFLSVWVISFSQDRLSTRFLASSIQKKTLLDEKILFALKTIFKNTLMHEACLVGMKQKGVQFNLVFIQLNVEACVVGMKQKGLQMKEIYSAELQSYS